MLIRFVVLAVALSFLAAPLAAEAQQAAKVWRIGYLSFAPSPDEAIFRDELRGLGYIEGKDVLLEYRRASPDPSAFPTLAADLVAVEVDVIVAVFNQAIVSAKNVTKTIPIVGVPVKKRSCQAPSLRC